MNDYIEQFRTLAALAAKEVGADEVEAALFQSACLLLLAKLRDKLHEIELSKQEWWWQQDQDDEWMRENI